MDSLTPVASIFPAPTSFDVPVSPKDPTYTYSFQRGNDDVYEVMNGTLANEYYPLYITNTTSFSTAFNFFYDSVVELSNGGIDTIELLQNVERVDRITGARSNYTTYTIPDNVENFVLYKNSSSFSIFGNASANWIIGGFGPNTMSGGVGNDALQGLGGDDVLDGGADFDQAVFTGKWSEYDILYRGNGAYTVSDRVPSRDGFDNVRNVEALVFSDRSISLETEFPFQSLVAANASQTKAIASIYQTLLGGIPSMFGFDFLIRTNIETNFGARSGVFNDENIYINIANALVQGNATAAAKFNSLATGNSLAEKVTSIYTKIIPAGKQSADGLAFLTRPEGLEFYASVARERGIVTDNGAAVTALASLLKVAVDNKIGVGNPVGDLLASITLGAAELPPMSVSVSPIELVDGKNFDADDALDFLLGFSESV